MDMIDRETAKTLNLNTPIKQVDKELWDECMDDCKGIFFDGVSLKLLHKLKQKYTSNKYVMSELIEELTNIINAKKGLEKEVEDLETNMNRPEPIDELDDIHTKYRHLNSQMCDIKSHLAGMKVDPKVLEQMFLNPEDIDTIYEENSREPDPIDVEDHSYQLDNIYQTNRLIP
jgi:predicted nuclease with TOPRIM domain